MIIVLTNRNPAEIDPNAWPVLASREIRQGNTRSELTVRRHADGRMLAYGTRSTGVATRDRAGGFLLDPGEDVHRAIRRVAGMIENHALGSAVLAAMPAERLT